MKKQFYIYCKIITSDYHIKTVEVTLHDATYKDVNDTIKQLKEKYTVRYIGVWEEDTQIIGGN